MQETKVIFKDSLDSVLVFVFNFI